jgi:YesN/AraC family two-component response regulator
MPTDKPDVMNPDQDSWACIPAAKSRQSLPKRILIVDDEPFIAQMFQRALSWQTNYEIRTAFDGLQALEMLEARPVDLLITDYDMPKMNGIELIQANRQQSSEAKAMIITAYDGNTFVGQAKRFGISTIIYKPVDIRTLREIVTAMLA